MKTINLRKIVRAALRESFTLGILGVTSVVLLGMSACSTGFDEPVTKKATPVTKDYNYLFKVIVPEEIMRSMTDEEHERMVAKIEKMGSILDEQIDRKYRNVEDVTLIPASVGAAAFVSKELRDTAEALIADGATILFSYYELLTDNSYQAEVKDGTQNGERSVGASGRVFVYDGQSNPRDNEAWKSGEVPSRGVEDESSNTDVNALRSNEARAEKNTEVMESFLENLVEQVASNPSVSMDIQDSLQTDGKSRSVEEQGATGATTISLDTAGSEMIVELEDVPASELRSMQRSIQNGDQRSWLSKGIKNVFFLQSEWVKNSALPVDDSCVLCQGEN